MSIFSNKTLGEYLIILMISLIILFVYYYIAPENTEHMESSPKNITWNRNQCSYAMNETLRDELAKYNITQSDKNWDIYFSCNYDNLAGEISKMPVIDGAKYFIIDNSDEMVDKAWLWKNIVDYYGLDIAKTMMPNGYILYNKKDMDRFDKEYDPNKIYIMKKNIQRQEGLSITKSKTDILNGFDKGYVIVPELLQNPYIISGRKTNMRFYVLIVCQNGRIAVYVHNDGFMYYTNDLFVAGSTEVGSNITTGYIDRKVYEENPLTNDDMRKYLNNPNRQNISQKAPISQVYFDRIYQLLRAIFIAFVGKICKNKKFINTTMFQLFGVDIAVDNQLNPMVMEINKGPDMDAKDQRDSELKHGVISDVLTIIGVVNKAKSRKPKFIKLFDVKNSAHNA